MDDMKEYTIKDLINIVYSDWKLFYSTSIGIVFITIIYVLVVSPLYMSKAKVLTNNGMGNSIGKISSLASQFGVSIGPGTESSSSDFSPEVYLEILNSRRLFNELCMITFNIKDNNNDSFKNITLLEYLSENSSYKSEEIANEYAFQEFYESVMKSSKNIDSSSITIEVRTKNKDLSFQLLESTVLILNKIQLDFKTEKIKSKKDFITQQIKKTSSDLELAENEWMKIQRSNVSPKSSLLLLKEEKLKREVIILTNVYTNLKNELEITKIEEVEQNKSVDIIDPPNYPVLKDWPKRKIMVIQSFFFGIILGSFYQEIIFN